LLLTYANFYASLLEELLLSSTRNRMKKKKPLNCEQPRSFARPPSQTPYNISKTAYKRRVYPATHLQHRSGAELEQTPLELHWRRECSLQSMKMRRVQRMRLSPMNSAMSRIIWRDRGRKMKVWTALDDSRGFLGEVVVA
jgi:hypothetical protein